MIIFSLFQNRNSVLSVHEFTSKKQNGFRTVWSLGGNFIPGKIIFILKSAPEMFFMLMNSWRYEIRVWYIRIYLLQLFYKQSIRCPLWDMALILDVYLSNAVKSLLSRAFSMFLPVSKWRRTLLVISRHCFRSWLGADRHQAITWTNVWW